MRDLTIPNLADDSLWDLASRNRFNVPGGFFIRPLLGEGASGGIRLDVREDDRAFYVQAELPGIRKEDIDLSLDRDLLNIRAEINQESTEKETDRMLRRERYCGAMLRSIRLPSEPDANAVTARYEDGVLHLTLPKKSGSTPQRLAIA